MSDHDKIVILGGGPNASFFARLMKPHDDRRALIISPADEETALQLLERLRKEGATLQAINSHPGLQALKKAWGGMELPAATPPNDPAIRMDREYIPEACTNSTPEEVLIKRGFVAPKHHMHLSASGIPTKRGRKR